MIKYQHLKKDNEGNPNKSFNEIKNIVIKKYEDINLVLN